MPFSTGNEIHRLYGVIFSWLRFNLVPVFTPRKSSRARRIFFLFASFSITFFHTLIFLSFLLSTMQNFLTRAVASIVVYSTHLIYRYALFWNTGRLLTTTERISRFRVTNDTKWKRWFFALMFSSFLQFFVTSLSVIVMVIKIDAYSTTREMLFGYGCSYEIFNKTFVVLHRMSRAFFTEMPVDAFLVFYICLCHDLRSAFDNFSESMAASVDINYDVLLSTFHSLSNAVTEIDDELNVMFFWATLAKMSSVYHALAFVVDFQSYRLSVHIFYVSCTLLHNILMFSMSCHFASSLSDTASCLSYKAHLMPENCNKSPLTHLRFLFAVGKEVHFTVCKLLPLTKNYILVLLGTIVTYSVLMDNLMKNK